MSGTFDWLIRRWVSDAVSDTLRREIPKIVDRRLPEILEAHMAKRFAEEPHLDLTEVGFSWAFYLALKKRWPGIVRRDSDQWLHDYIDAPIGSAGYDWTPAAASGLASSYADEYGEVQS